MRCTSLSSDKVLDVIDEFFVPLAINVTCDRWASAAHLPALRMAEQVYASNWRFEFGFASCVMLTPDGQHALGWIGGTKDERSFLEVMVTSLESSVLLRSLFH